MKRARRALLVAVCSTLFAAQALAEDAEVTQRLQSHGGLSGAAAKRLSTKVAQRMMKSADTLAPPSDPLRVAMSQALFHAAVPPDNMAAAKMRLKLYVGLNASTLETLFLPKPGAIASCVRAIGATQPECEALVAAAGRQSVVDARTAAGGPAVAAPVVMARTAPAAAPPAAGGGHFGKFKSGFQGAAPAPAYAAAAPVARPATTQFGAARAPARATAAPSGMSRKEAYQAQRDAYLARQKAIHDERKQKLDAVSAGEADAPAPAAVASAAPAKAAPAAKTKPGAATAPAEAAAAEEAPAEAAPPEVAKNGPALEGDFLDGLLADPLGKK